MKIFGISSSNSLEVEIEKATSEKNTNEKWGLIMEICDKIGTSSGNAKDSLRIIMKRLSHPDPHVVVQAITLLDACVNNCGKNYHLEIASREFEQEYRKLIQKSQPPIANKLKTCLKKWAENDFKKDPQLNLIPSLYNKMKQEGHSFSDTESTPKREVELSKDPNVVSSQQEEDDIAKAIELSLKEKTGSPKAQGSSYSSSSLYPSMNVSSPATSGTGGSVPALVEPRKVRALYDFEAAEDNELTFKAGEIIMVLEESDPNWWRGTNHRGEGFFPANFVTADLSAEPEDLTKDIKSSKRVEQFHNDQQNIHNLPVEINEDSIDRLLFLLHEADPSDPSQDSDEMLRLENVVNQMGPLIDSELERVDRKHAQLTQLSSDLIDTINLYHSLMRETERAPALGIYSSFSQAHPHPQQMYSPLGFPPNSVEQYRMSTTNMISARGMMMVPTQGMVYPPSSALPHGNFQMSAQPAGSFQPSQPNQMVPPVSPQQNMPSMNHHMTNGMVQNIQQSGNLQQMPRQMMHSDGMVPQGPLMTATAIQHQAPTPHYPQHHQQQPPQQNGFPQTNFQPIALPHPGMQQQIESMGNLSLQPPPASMMNQVAQQSQITQITQPMTYNLQADSNQNIPLYQQR